MTTNSRAFPPLDGSLSVIPGFVDFQAQYNSDKPWVVFPIGSPIESISYKQFSDATHRMARAVRPDGTRANGEVVAVIIHCDTVLYLALLVGLIRAGFIPFPMSPKNSIPAFVNMFEKTGCHHVVSQPVFAPIVAAVKSQLELKQFDVKVEDLTSLHEIFPEFSGKQDVVLVEPFPPTKPHHPDDIVLYIHSSGSTGLPKPVPQRQKMMLQWSSSMVLKGSRERATIWGSMPLPTFHTFGIYMQFYAPLTTSFPIGLYYPLAPAPPVIPTPANLIDACRGTKATAVPIVPAFIEAWAQSEESIKYLASLQTLLYAGGPLSRANGEKLVAAGVPVCNVYGGTEYGAHTTVFDVDYTQEQDPKAETDAKTKEDWEYLAFSDYVKTRWAPQGDGTYELQFLTCEGHTPAVENLPDTRGYATSDLFVPHPIKKGLWKIAGRKDDVLVLATGEKVVPIPQEGQITSSSMVSGAVMFGRGKNTCGVLIEPLPEHSVDPEDPTALVAFRNKIWHVVEKANDLAPTFARIFKEMIIVTRPDKPLPRAAKGTVVRPQAIQLYSKEVEELYHTVAESADVRGIPPPLTWTANDVEAWLMKHSASINNEVEVLPSTDMFDQGFDSLHATFLRNRIIGTMRTSDDSIVQQAAARVPQNFIFDNPSLRALSIAIATLINSEAHDSAPDVEQEIQRMVDHYTSHIPKPEFVSNAKSTGGIVVLLTGSTGNVGSHLLADLLTGPNIERVYTLNRGLDIRSRQASAFADRNLPVDLLSGTKYVPLTGDVTLESMGLDFDAFAEIKACVTHVIHNAWRVDFNLSLSTFEKYVAGTRRLVDVCCSFNQPVKLLFTSSIAAAHGWDATHGPVPEAVLTDPRVAAATGYGASKFVAENIIGKAAENGLEASSIRIGQVCGSKTTGAWSTTEWVPIIVKSSIALKLIPDLNGVISWIPMDGVTAAVMDLVKSDRPWPVLVNAVHPHPIQWNEIFNCINRRLGQHPFPVVPFKDWLQALETIAVQSAPADLERVPAIKILQFFRNIGASENTSSPKDAVFEAGGMPTYATSKLCQVSPAMNSLEPLSESHANAWIAYWSKKGFLSL